MISITRPAFLAVFLAALLGGTSLMADDAERIRRQLDRLNKSIADARAFPADSSETLEELRRDLFQAALATRDAKKRSDDVEKAIKEGQNPTLELDLLRSDIAAAGNILRGLRDRMDEYDRINKNTEVLLEDLARSIQKLDQTLIQRPADIEKAVAARTRDLQEQVEELTGKLAKRDAEIARLEEKVASKSNEPPPPAVDNRITSASLASGFNLLSAGKIAEAQAEFEKVLGLDPASSDARAGIAACRLERNDVTGAAALVDEVLALDGKNARALGVKGALLFREGRLKDARKSLERAIKYDATVPYFYNHLGVVLSSLGRDSDAQELFKKAIELDPQYAAALYNLSVLLANDTKTPDIGLARYYYQRALALGHPREPLMDQSLGVP